MGARDEEEMKQQLMDLMQGSNGNYEDMLRKAELEKNGQSDDL